MAMRGRREVGWEAPPHGLILALVVAGSFGIASEASALERLALPGTGIGRPSDQMGVTTALFGDIAAVGAPGTQFVNGYPGGDVSLYRSEGGSWQSEAVLTPTSSAGARFGSQVALGQDVLVVSSDTSLVTFERDGSTWQQVDEMDGVYASSYGKIGLSGDTLAALGSVFVRSGTGWSLQAALATDTFDRVRSMAIDGDRVVVGADGFSLGPPPQAVYFYSRSGTEWTREARFDLSMGYSPVEVAISGDTALVGWAGASVHVYQRDDAGAWTDQGTLDTGGPLPGDVSLSIEGDRAVVGSPGDYTAYLFERSGADWQRVQHFNDPNSYCFRSVTLSGPTLLAGCPASYASTVGWGLAEFFSLDQTPPAVIAKFGQGDARAGLAFGTVVAAQADTILATAIDGVHFYGAGPSGWIPAATLPPTPGHVFAAAAALDGDIAAVGYTRYSSNDPPADVGIYTQSGGTWSFQTRIPLPSGISNTGIAVAVQDDTLVVGDSTYDGASQFLGSCHMYTRSGTAWIAGADINPPGSLPNDLICYSVAMSGDTLLVGAPATDIGISTDAGAVYVFTRRGVQWGLEAKLVAPLATPGASFGGAVAIRGNTAVVGAGLSGGIPAGRDVNVFKRVGTTWTWQATLEAPSTIEYFGRAIAISDSEDRVIASGIDDSVVPSLGVAYVFDLEGTSWVGGLVLRATPPSPPIASDGFGSSLAFAGSAAVIGAPYDGIGGAVYVGPVSEAIFANGFDP
jgi:hypothetical protein